MVGSHTSANSKRLVKIASAFCPQSFLINTADDIKSEWLLRDGKPIEKVGISAGASTPDFLIDGAIERLREMAPTHVEVVYPSNQDVDNKLALENNRFG